MGNLTLALVGLGVFALMVTGLVWTMIEFHRVSDRPDLVRGAKVRSVQDWRGDRAA